MALLLARMYVASRLISHASPSWQTWCTRELAHAVPGGRHTRAHARAETWRWPPGRSQQTKALSGTGPHRKELQRVRAQQHDSEGDLDDRPCARAGPRSAFVSQVHGVATCCAARYNPPAGSLQPSRRFATTLPPVRAGSHAPVHPWEAVPPSSTGLAQ
jgi:hypothetical protein